jgi:hypothetical protein
MKGNKMKVRNRRAVAPPTNGDNGKSYLKRGVDAIMAEAEKNLAEIDRRRSQGGNVFRFYVPKGEECEIIILDKSLNDVVAFYEHNLQDSRGQWSIYEPCLKDLGVECPLCKAGHLSYYQMILSVLVLKPYTTKMGKVIPHTKMIMPVKQGQFDLFRRLEQAAKREGKTLRGMYLVMARSKTDPKAPRIGEPVMLDNNKLFDFFSEEELVEEFGHEAVLGQDGKTIVRPKNYNITPYDYTKLFPPPNVKEMMARYGDGSPAAGSIEEAAIEFDETPSTEAQEEEAITPSRRRVSQTEEVVEEAEEDEPQTTRRRASGKPNPFED